jgi:hypothetical protein
MASADCLMYSKNYYLVQPIGLAPLNKITQPPQPMLISRFKKFSCAQGIMERRYHMTLLFNAHLGEQWQNNTIILRRFTMM